MAGLTPNLGAEVDIGDFQLSHGTLDIQLSDFDDSALTNLVSAAGTSTSSGASVYAVTATGVNPASLGVAFYPNTATPSAATLSHVANHFTARLLYGDAIQPMLPIKCSATFYDYATSIVNDSPTLWYRFSDYAYSAIVADTSGGNNPGTLNGGVQLQQQGIILDSSPALATDGVAAYISTPYSGNLGFTTALSVEFWVNVTTLQPGVLAAQMTDINNMWSIAVVPQGGQFLLKWRVRVGGVSYTQYSGPMSVGAWYHVFATYGGSALSLWVNNQQAGPAVGPAALSLTGSTLYIGQDGLSNYAAAVMDEFALYSSVPSPTRIAAHFQSGLGNGGDTRVFPLFYGFVDRAEHNPDPASQSTMISAVDFFEQLNLVTPTIATQYRQRADQIIKTVLSFVPLTDPNFLNLEVGPDSIAAWGDAVTGQNTCITLFQNLMLSDQGLVYVDGAGAVTYKNRGTRYAIPKPVAIWDGAMLGPSSKPSADKRLIFNYEAAVRQFSQQTLSLSGSASGGTFQLTLDGQVTANINWNATALQVQAALQALSNVGLGGVLCSGGPLNASSGNAITCNFIGYRLSLVLSLNNLTGGTSPSITISNSIASSTTQIYQDPISQKDFGLRAFSGAGGGSAADASTNWTTDTEASSFAAFIVLVNKGSRPPLRTGRIQNGPALAGANEAPRRLWQILSRDLSDVVTVNLTSAVHGGMSFSQGSVQSVQMDVSEGGRLVNGSITVQPTSATTLGGLFTIGVSKFDGVDQIGY